MVSFPRVTTAAGRIFLLGGVLKLGAVSEFISNWIVRVFGVDSSPPHPLGESMKRETYKRMRGGFGYGLSPTTTPSFI